LLIEPVDHSGAACIVIYLPEKHEIHRLVQNRIFADRLKNDKPRTANYKDICFMEDTYFAYDNITGFVQVDVKIVNPAYKKRWLSGSALQFYDFILPLSLHSLSTKLI
jgi:hypothetical protein